MPIISVIVPVYKVEPYLRRCVDSILAQTFTDFELILVDDGSPDNCGAMCDEYAQKDARVHVIHQANGGLSAARNAGIDWVFAHSDSEWITFVDSDDWIHVEMIRYLYKAVTQNHVRISICKYERTCRSEECVSDGIYCCDIMEPESFFVDQRKIASIGCGKLYHIGCFESIRYPFGLIHEDEYTTYRILFKEQYIAFVNSALYYYYVNLDGITKQAWKPERMNQIIALEGQLCFFKQNGYNSAYDRTVYSYGCVLAEQIKDSKGVQEYRKYNNELRKKLKQLLRRCDTKRIFRIDESNFVFEAAYPHVMDIYWKYLALINKLKRSLVKI